MSFSLYSLGRLVGTSDLDFLFAQDGHRRGWLYTTADGEQLAEIAAGVSSTMSAVTALDDLETAAAAIALAVDRRNALELELRGPDGAVVPVERLVVRDTVVLMALADATMPQDGRSWYASLSDEERQAFDAFVDRDADMGDAADMVDLAETPEAFDENTVGRGLPRFEVEVRLIGEGRENG